MLVTGNNKNHFHHHLVNQLDFYAGGCENGAIKKTTTPITTFDHIR
jgi:hypothetical protein